MDKAVWQPKFTASKEFQVMLNEDFIHEVRDAEIPEDYGGLEGYRETIQSLGEDILEEEGQMHSRPYNFENNSALITGVHIGNNGTWLSKSRNSPSREAVTYDSHNVDTSYEQMVLQKLFGEWTEKTAYILEQSD